MSKKGIWILTGVMGLAILGLLLVQAQWIKNAIDIKEQQFSYVVNRALGQLISSLEEEEASFGINYEISPYLDSLPNGVMISTQSSYSWVNTGEGETKSSETHRSDTSYLYNDGEVVIHTSVTGDTANLRRQQEQEEREKLMRKYVTVEKVMNRMLKGPLSIEERLDPALFHKRLNYELMQRGIELDFEFAIKKPDRSLYYKSDGFEEKTRSKVFLWQLYPNDMSAGKNVLTLYFPRDRNYLYKSLGWMGTSSILLTLTILLIFGATLYIIFRQKQLSRIKTDFVNNMTHELKTPISTISLASQMLKDDSLQNGKKKTDHIGRIIEDESKRLSHQVEKVLQMAVFDRGPLKLKLGETDLHSIIMDAVENFEIILNNKNGEIELKLNAGKSKLIADEVHLNNIISNLIDNAIKYSNGHPHIIINTGDTKKGLLISVKDNGIGISREDQKRIFQRFYRVPTGNVHNVKGFGLGLNYVKMMVEAHGGKISIESKTGEGSMFKILLPHKN